MAASWKKVLVSGSAGEFTSVTASSGILVGTTQVIGATQASTSLTGSFTGSFAGSLAGTASWAVSASNVISSSYAATASYALNSVGGTLNISASDNTNTSITLSTQALIVSGTANEVEVTVNNSNRILQIGLPNNVSIAGNLTVAGTLTSVSASSLIVSDKFIVLSSGSTTKNDGGIIIQSSATPANTGSGYGFILDGSPVAPRWGVTSSLSPTATDNTTPDEYMVTAKTVAGTYTAGSTAPTYGGATATGNGNMIIDGNGDIWIYVN